MIITFTFVLNSRGGVDIWSSSPNFCLRIAHAPHLRIAQCSAFSLRAHASQLIALQYFLFIYFDMDPFLNSSIFSNSIKSEFSIY